MSRLRKRIGLVVISSLASALLVIAFADAERDDGRLGVAALILGLGLVLGALIVAATDASRRRRSGWLIVIFVSPALGPLLYALFGMGEPSRIGDPIQASVRAAQPETFRYLLISMAVGLVLGCPIVSLTWILTENTRAVRDAMTLTSILVGVSAGVWYSRRSRR